MAVIKFDKDKARTLIKELSVISSDIETNLNGIGSSVIDKEISLLDSRLKVFGFRDKVIEIIQDDDSVVEEIIKEKYLKSDYTPFARTFNSVVKSMGARVESSRSNTSKAIGDVVNSLKKVLALVEEFENDSSLRMASSLDSVGQYNFNFLAPHGPSTSIGVGAITGMIAALVAEEALPSELLGPLGERPSIIDLAKLEIFDHVFDVARDEKTSEIEKLILIGELIVDRAKKIDDEEKKEKTKKAFKEMAELIASKKKLENIKEKDKVEYLINQGVEIIKPLVSTSGIALASGVAAVGQAILQNKENTNSKVAKIEKTLDNVADNKINTTNNGVNNNISNGDNSGEKVNIKTLAEESKNNTVDSSKEGNSEILEANKNTTERNSRRNNIIDDEIENEQNKKNELVVDDIKYSSKDLALEEELRVSNITASYDTSTVSESSNMSEADVPVEDIKDVKGAGIVAGAAGVGALGKIASSGPSSASAPAMGGMSAGELLGINNSGNDVMATPVMGTTTASSSGSTVSNSTSSSKSAVGGESTSDRGSSGSSNSNDKNISNKSSGKGSTLEDKKQEDEENSYGKPNKPEDVEENNEKGMLGDASIAELNAKDEKQIKIATGVSAGGALGSVVLAVAGIMPSFLLILLLLLIIVVYTTYRVKKKYDKKKRMEMIARQKQEKAEVNVPTTLEEVQNVSDIEVSSIEEEQQEILVDIENSSTNDEFSEQPYEPSRDGVTEIGINSDKNE